MNLLPSPPLMLLLLLVLRMSDGNFDYVSLCLSVSARARMGIPHLNRAQTLRTVLGRKLFWLS